MWLKYCMHVVECPAFSCKFKIIYFVPNPAILHMGMDTVNQLNFAALKFRGLPLLSLIRPFKFRVLVSQDPFLTKTLFHKNSFSSLNNGLVFKI